MHATNKRAAEELAETIVDAEFAVAGASFDEREGTFSLRFWQAAPPDSRHQPELLKETWYARTYAVPQVWADLVVRHVLSVDPPLESLTEPAMVEYVEFVGEEPSIRLVSVTSLTVIVRVSDIDIALTFSDDVAIYRRVSHGLGGWESSGPLDDPSG